MGASQSRGDPLRAVAHRQQSLVSQRIFRALGNCAWRSEWDASAGLDPRTGLLPWQGL